MKANIEECKRKMALVFDNSGVVGKENELKHLEREERKYLKEVEALLHVHGI